MNPYSLLTDLYEITMMGGYFAKGRHLEKASFEYFFRKLPGQSGYAVLCGIEDFAEKVSSLRFTEDEIVYLRGLRHFSEEFLSALREFRFNGDVDAAPEGSVVFPCEPLVKVQGDLWAVQMVETLLLNCLNYPTLVATKAARICQAAGQDPVLEFGLRRAQGPNGGLLGSRAAYVGGCAATSNVEAGRVYGLPVRGTHAHSWVMSFPDERSAFQAYADVYPDSTVLLVDTHDTLAVGMPNAIQVFTDLRRRGWKGRPAIRIDSGDLGRVSQAAYDMLTEASFMEPLIIGSGDLDEYQITALKSRGTRVNCWGVGTHLIVSEDCPALGGVYKLAAMEEKGRWVPRMKVSGDPVKTTDPGLKKVIRLSRGGFTIGDVVSGVEEALPEDGEVFAVTRSHEATRMALGRGLQRRELLQPLMRRGERLTPPRAIDEIRAFASEEISDLTWAVRRLENPESYPVFLSEALAGLKNRMLEEIRRVR